MTDQQNPVPPTTGSSPADTQTNQSMSYVDDYQPPQTPTATSMPSMPTPPPATPMIPVPASSPTPMITSSNSDAGGPDSQALEDQNIFYLLGVDDGNDEEKEAFLDELQQVIWEDFLENDVQLLITEEEKGGLKAIQDNQGLGDADKQEQMVVYLEKLIPDLEEIMLEKALELKEDMVRERIAGMREYFSDRPESVAKLDEAENLLKEDRWRDAADILNNLKA